MDGVTSLVEVVCNRFVLVVVYIHKKLSEVGVKGASNFADVEFGTFCAMNNAQICLAV